MPARLLGVAPTAATDGATKAYVDAVRGRDGGGYTCLTYRGYWDRTSAYYSGDLVSFRGRGKYMANYDQPAANSNTIVGTSGATNASAHTTATVVTLPAGAASGDMCICAVTMHAQYAAVAGTDLQMSITPGSWTTIERDAASGGTAATAGAEGSAWTILNPTAIATGSVTVPAQNLGYLPAGLSVDVVLLVLRGPNTIWNVGLGAAATATSATAASATAILPTASFTTANSAVSFTVWIGAVHVAAGRSTGVTVSPGAATSSIVQQPAAGNGLGALAVAVAAGELDPAETMTQSLSGSMLWAARAHGLQVGYTETVTTNFWTTLPDQAGGIAKVLVAAGSYSPTSGEFVIADATAGNITIVLPDAAGDILMVKVKRVDSVATRTVTVTSSATIDGAYGSSASLSVLPGDVYQFDWGYDTQVWYSQHVDGDDTGLLNSGKITNATGATWTSMNFRKVGKVVNFYGVGTYPAITVASTGNIANTNHGTISDTTLRPQFGVVALASGATGDIAAFIVTSTGIIQVVAFPPGHASITSGTAFSCGGSWLVP